MKQNKAHAKKMNLFEIGKVYSGKHIKEHKEIYMLGGISIDKSFYEIKGILEIIFEKFGNPEDPGKYIEVLPEGIFFEINYTNLLEAINQVKTFVPLPKYPPIIEDITLIVSDKIKTGIIIDEIKKQSPLISEVSFLDQFENSRTFHIVYLDKEKNLTNEDILPIREKIVKQLQEKYKVTLKE